MNGLFAHKQITKKYKKILRKYYFIALRTKYRGLRQMRMRALRLLSKQLKSLTWQGFYSGIVLGIAEKKADIITMITTDQEFGELLACSYPRFDGTRYVPSVQPHIFVPEEECVHWANFFSSGCASAEGSQRYDLVLRAAFPDADDEFIEKLRKNKLRGGYDERKISERTIYGQQ